MLVAIKKYKFYIIKTKFYKFIIKLKKESYKLLVIQFGFINIPAIF